MKDLKIAVVNSSSFGRIFPEHLEKLKEFGTVERFDLPPDSKGKRLAEVLKGFQVIIASVTPFYDREFFENQDDVVLITRHGIGYNNIDVDAATDKGVLITRVPGEVEREAMAEHTITLMLTVMRRIVPAFSDVKGSKWRDRARHVGFELRGKTVGVIGIGNIGSRVAEILKTGFSVNVLAYDPKLSEDDIRRRGAVPVPLEELLRKSDVITLHAPLTDETHHMIGEREFELMKEGVVIVNTARGELIDTNALMRALEKGKVFGVGMDVVEDEPIDGDHPLLKFENVVVVPHIGAYTFECLKGMGDKVVSDVEKIATGEIPGEVINPEVLERGSRLDGLGR